MGRNIYTREKDDNRIREKVRKLLMENNRNIPFLKIMELSEIILQPKFMMRLQESLTSDRESDIDGLVIRDDLSQASIEDLDKLFDVFFSKEERQSFADAFLQALKERTVHL